VARRRKPLLELSADRLEIAHLSFLLTCLRRIETTSRPPKEVSATVIPQNTNPARPASLFELDVFSAEGAAPKLRYDIASGLRKVETRRPSCLRNQGRAPASKFEPAAQNIRRA
jgi:hypothetical protein